MIWLFNIDYSPSINYFQIRNDNIKEDINNLKLEFEQLINNNKNKEKFKTINNENINNNNCNINIKSYKNEILILKQENKKIKEIFNEIKKENENIYQENTQLKKEQIEFNSIKEDNIKLSEINKQLNGINIALKGEMKELEIEKKNNLSQIKKLINLNEEQKNNKLILEKNLEEKKQETINLLSKLNLVQKENDMKINENIEKQKEENDKTIKNLKNELNRLNNIINLKEKEINDYKLINNQLIGDNTKKQEKIAELMDNSQQETFILTLENLKQEIKEYKEKINHLTNQNNELNELLKKKNIINPVEKNNLSKKKFQEIEEEFEPNRFQNKYKINNYSNTDEKIRKSQGVFNQELQLEEDQNLLKYKERIKDYKEQIDLHLMQINTLKDEIKECKLKLNKPIVKNYDEFVKLFNLAFTGYKPFRKDQNDAFELIKQKFVLNNDI